MDINLKTNAMVGTVVRYLERYFLVWNVNSTGRVQLIDSYGNKFSGTPAVEKVEIIKQLPIIKYGNGKYVVDRYQRIFSMVTGKRVYNKGVERNKILRKCNMECV